MILVRLCVAKLWEGLGRMAGKASMGPQKDPICIEMHVVLYGIVLIQHSCMYG